MCLSIKQKQVNKIAYCAKGKISIESANHLIFEFYSVSQSAF